MPRNTSAKVKRVNVSSWARNPVAVQLSNFAPAEIVVTVDREDFWLLGFTASELEPHGCEDGLEFGCGSAEGFVQGMKARDFDRQIEIARLSGKAAKRAGAGEVAEIHDGARFVFFVGKQLRYAGREHRALIEYSIVSKFAQDKASQTALRETGSVELTHNLGKYDAKPGKTSLPKQVFVRILNECRTRLQEDQPMLSLREILHRVRTDELDELRWYLPTSDAESVSEPHAA